jgi:GAF domain-containing protein
VLDVESILQALLAETHASRVTLRRGVSDGYVYPVTAEALAPGVASLKEERTVDLRVQPVVREVQRRGQVVQDDCRAANDDAAFQQMLETYGGLAAQIVTAVVAGNSVAAIVSVHQLGSSRQWSKEEVEACRLAAARLAELL